MCMPAVVQNPGVLICNCLAGIVSSLADERHGAEVYEKTFKYILGTLMKVDDKGLAQHIAHYRQTAAARVKAWEMKAVQSKVRAHTDDAHRYSPRVHI